MPGAAQRHGKSFTDAAERLLIRGGDDTRVGLVGSLMITMSSAAIAAAVIEPSSGTRLLFVVSGELGRVLLLGQVQVPEDPIRQPDRDAEE